MNKDAKAILMGWRYSYLEYIESVTDALSGYLNRLDELEVAVNDGAMLPADAYNKMKDVSHGVQKVRFKFNWLLDHGWQIQEIDRIIDDRICRFNAKYRICRGYSSFDEYIESAADELRTILDIRAGKAPLTKLSAAINQVISEDNQR
jgi:hypothetical protein